MFRYHNFCNFVKFRQEYELAVVVGGTKMIMLLQAITGPLFTWMLWILAFTVVTMGYVDHVCVGWDKVMPGVQLVSLEDNRIYSINYANSPHFFLASRFLECPP